MLNEQFPWVDMMEFDKRTAFSLVVTAGKATFVCHNHIIENRRFGLKYVHISLFWLYLLVLPHNAIFQPMEKKKLLFFIGSPVLGRYINGNHSVTLWADGSKHRATGHWEDRKKQFPFFKRMKATILEAIHRKPTEYAWVKDDQDHLYFDFPENFDIKITDQCDGGCAYCHENSTVNGKHGDLRGMEAVFRSLHRGTEAAIGGGNALAHPDLMWLLNVLKEQGVVANITVNQRHLQKYREMLLQLVNDKLVHGIGVSLTDSANQDDLKIVEELGKNVVIHVIAGIFSEKDIPFVKGRKMLILGYKDLRRGHSLLEHHSEDIKAKIQWLKEYLPTLKDETKLISFDCLGIEQIDPKTVLKLSDDEFNYLYQGSDTDVFDSEGHIACSTMYIDVPNMTVARMSTASLDKRFPFTGKENISDLLKLTTQGW